MDLINDIVATLGKESTRFSYSHEDKKVREYILQELERLEMEIKIDGECFSKIR